tara:strand:- start:3125 stop:3967 length:843 start_codon:yes stop_codon:yes gene_type:complete
MRRRPRTLSTEGLELFNIAVDLPPTIEPPTRMCLKNIFINLFTTDFDIHLKKSKTNFRAGTCSLYSYLKEEEQKEIPNFFNNAIANLVYLILVNEGKPNKYFQIKKNISFYLSLADQAYNSGDHNTVILIKAALENTCIRRLNIKPKKKQKNLFEKFEKTYGTFTNCNAGHLKQILINKDKVEQFLPSVFIILMHMNKTKEYAKCYETIGKFPKELKNKHKELTYIANSYYNSYKDFKSNILELYLKNPMELELIKNIKGKNINEKLFKLSMLVKIENKK